MSEFWPVALLVQRWIRLAGMPFYLAASIKVLYDLSRYCESVSLKLLEERKQKEPEE